MNERVARMHAGYHRNPDPDWVCECGDEACFERVTVAVDDYREIRGHGNWFVIRPGHEKPDVERIVRERDDYVVVEKLGA